MKITVEREELTKALAPAYRIAKGKQTVPILNNVLLSAADARLRIAGNDTMACAAASCSAEIETPGAVTVAGEALRDLCNKMPEGCQVTAELLDGELIIKFGRSRYKLPTLPADEFPDMMVAKDAIEFLLTKDQVDAIFARTKPFASHNDASRPYLEGVHLRQGKGTLIGEASDGTRLMQRAVKMKVKGLPSVIVGTSSVDSILDLAKEGGTFRCSQNYITVESDGMTFTSRLVEGTFPDLQRVIPDVSSHGSFSCDREDLIAALARLMALDEESGVRFSWEKGAEQVLLSLASGSGDGTEPIAAEIKKLDAGSFGVAPRLIKQLLDETPGEIVDVYFIDAGSPIRIGQKLVPDLVGIVMPRRV